MGHTTDQCPQLADQTEEVKALYNPFSNHYNPGTRNHPNFRWSNNDNVLKPQGEHRPAGFQPRPAAPQNQYDEILKTLASGQNQLNQVTATLVAGQKAQGDDIAELKNQVGKLVDFMSRFSNQGKLPSNTVPNPRNDEVQAVTRSGTDSCPK